MRTAGVMISLASLHVGDNQPSIVKGVSSTSLARFLSPDPNDVIPSS